MRLPAKRKLRDWLKDKGWGQKELADTLGAQQSSVSRWCDDNSKERPNDRRRALIEELTGIDAAEWQTAKECRAAEKAEARVRPAGAAE